MGCSSLAYPLSSTPAANSMTLGGGKMKRERSSAHMAVKWHKNDEVKFFRPKKKALIAKNAYKQWKKYVVLHLNIVAGSGGKVLHVIFRGIYLVLLLGTWELMCLYRFQQPELPDLPTVSLPISTSALPTFNFTSPLPASALGNTSSVTVTPVRKVLTVRVCVHFVNSLN